MATAVTFAAEGFDESNPFNPTDSYLQFGFPDPGPLRGAFRGVFSVPATLPSGRAVTPGVYYVSGLCCLATTTCNIGGGPAFRYLTVRTFCVSDPTNPCSWFYWGAGPLGAWNFFGQRFIDHIANAFALPAAPPPPPGETPTTTSRRGSTPNNPPVTNPSPPPPPPASTTTTTCIKGKTC
jgi:hypothetical protein